ncbi:MAG: hypothetical protein ACETVR_00880 [Candidatus Bathyarchaeia archaeon]
MDMKPQDLLIGGLRKWVSAAQTMERRLSTMRVTLREVEGEAPERAKRLEDLLTKFSDFIPKMVKIMEKAIVEIGEIP